MTGVQLVGHGGTDQLVYRTDLPTPVPGPGEVLIRVVAAGVCRTDLYAARGRLPVRDQVILGHEFSGVVDAVGPGVRKCEPEIGRAHV